jgi:nitric oxide dioxygenase
MHQELKIVSPDQIALVQTSFQKVLPIADVAAQLLYQRLFELDPSLRSLFRRDMATQRQMVMATLRLGVESLNDPARIVPALRALGAKHVAYGVKEADYATVGAALLWALEQGLGGDFTSETRAAWAAAYDLLSSPMIEAAAEHARPEAAD